MPTAKAYAITRLAGFCFAMFAAARIETSIEARNEMFAMDLPLSSRA